MIYKTSKVKGLIFPFEFVATTAVDNSIQRRVSAERSCWQRLFLSNMSTMAVKCEDTCVFFKCHALMVTRPMTLHTHQMVYGEQRKYEKHKITYAIATRVYAHI